MLMYVDKMASIHMVSAQLSMIDMEARLGNRSSLSAVH